jgi:energy-coupling factor transport system permease protein
MLDPRVWLLWALTTLGAASLTRNPLYTVILALVAAVVGTVSAPRDGGQRVVFSPLRFAAVAIPLSALFNALTVHVGGTTIFRLPSWLPLLGGPVTLEAFVFGVQNGLVLTVIFAGFAAFNQATPVRDLVGLAPRAFHEAGVVISIALTFVPQTMRSLNRIRQAQAVRGYRLRGLRDWPPIVVPLLISGLERSMGLAEAMVARGYGAVSDQAQPLRTSAGLVLGLLTLLGGWLTFLFWPAWREAGIGLMIGGGTLIVGVVWLAGRSVRHTVYRPRPWTARDTLAVTGCGLTLAITLTQREALYYSPYPRLILPPFDPCIGLGLLGLLAPAVAITTNQASRVRSPRSERVDWADQNSGRQANDSL